ncbi:uncharacterized protein YqfB (UPF0267 family) [Paenibacillus turicensis]|uniref:Uncharacterized protein YqfB (UPF0267 family) n=1 Tax=Paenibacillus turicensis TaxID=160487 RepID=A0ABS4FWW9_9BACL|nr:hypothetical protein [Paenibacillus turicensis]MBP1907070.1 uncharacterized protein YqfB (UPF0267 family) [Paenibacillus turicensis]
MYKLVSGQLYKIEKIPTSTQNAVITTPLYPVVGYDLEEPIEFDSYPEKEEREGKVAELHYKEGQLIWVYTNEPEKELTETDVIGIQHVKLQLTVLEMKKQLETLIADSEKKTAEIIELTTQNQVLGSLLSSLKLQVLAMKGGNDASV